MLLDKNKLRENKQDPGWYYIDDTEYFEGILARLLLLGAKPDHLGSAKRYTGPVHAPDPWDDVILYCLVNGEMDQLLPDNELGVWQINPKRLVEFMESMELIK